MSSFGTVGQQRETSSDELTASARKKVAAAARRGTRPADVFSPEDLSWCFRGREQELAELAEEADLARAAERERERAKRESVALQRETERVLAEMHKAEREARHAKAVAEAKKRLR
jgi:hypothetical protein